MAASPGPGDFICITGGTHYGFIGLYKHTKKYGKYAMVYVLVDWWEDIFEDLEEDLLKPVEDVLQSPLLQTLVKKNAMWT